MPPVARITRWLPFCQYVFLPDVKGRVYAVGFGKLMADITSVIDTIINQALDAGGAQVAGGGFIASGLRLGSTGQGGALRFSRGEYKVVQSSGGNLHQQIWERPLPGPSAVLQGLLEMLLDAAKDMASVKDVLTGDTPSTAPVGTTLAVANQALQVFSSIYKRVYRGLKGELALIAEAECRWGAGDAQEPEEYRRVTGAAEGDWAKDFAPGVGADIEPVADPNVVSHAQAMAKAQVGVGLLGAPWAQAAGISAREVAQRVFEAAGEDDIDKLLPAPTGPSPADQLEMQHKAAVVDQVKSETLLNQAKAQEAVGGGMHATALATREGRPKSGHEVAQDAAATLTAQAQAHTAAVGAAQAGQPEDDDAGAPGGVAPGGGDGA
jgi:hypothetical protein